MQRKIRDSRARFKVVACGRRFGKTFLGAVLCIECALAGGVAWWVAPIYPTSRIGWRIMVRLAKQIPGTKINKSDRIIEFASGGWIEIKSATDPDSLRGEGLSLVVIDECADVAEEAWVSSLEPSLTDKLGSALFIGTPKGRNWFYRLWMSARTEELWEAFRAPSHSNPILSRKELARIERRTPKRTWRQEFLAEFVTFEGRVYETFSPDGAMCFTEPPKMSDYTSFFGGIDFGFRNPTAIVVAGENKDGRIDVLEERYASRLKPEEIVAEVRALQDKYSVRQWWGDAADPRMIDVLQTEDLPVSPSPRGTGGQDTFVQFEIRLVSGLLEEEEPALRFYAPQTQQCIREHDGYRYPKLKEGQVERESPLKVDDHTCNAVQYMVHGMHEWYGRGDGITIAGKREAWSMPT